MATNTDSAASGGLLVVLGIIVALGAVYFFAHGGTSGPKGPDISIHADVPAAPATPKQ